MCIYRRVENVWYQYVYCVNAKKVTVTFSVYCFFPTTKPTWLIRSHHNHIYAQSSNHSLCIAVGKTTEKKIKRRCKCIFRVSHTQNQKKTQIPNSLRCV